MAKRESGFRQKLGEILEANDFMYQPIESGETGFGIPDVYFSSKDYKISGWIELKRIRTKILDKPLVKVPYRPGQFQWLTRHYEHGGLSMLGIEFDDGYVLFKNGDIQREYIPPLEIDLFATDRLTIGYFLATALGVTLDRQKDT